VKIDDKVLTPVVFILIVCAVWIAALDFGLSHAKPEVILHTKDTSRYVEKPVYVEAEKPAPTDKAVKIIEVEKPVYIMKEIEVPVEIPVVLKDWGSLESLEEFLINDDTGKNVILIADSEGKINFDGQCEEYALQLRDRAMVIGMYLSIAVLHPKEYEKWYGKQANPNQYHAICMARIGNEFWYIEPQTDKHWLALYLD